MMNEANFYVHINCIKQLLRTVFVIRDIQCTSLAENI